MNSGEKIMAYKRTSENISVKSEMFSLLYKSRIGFIILNVEGVILEVNDYWLNILGYCRDELIGQRFEKFLNKSSGLIFKESLNNINSIGEFEVPRLKITNKDGRYITASISGQSSSDSGNFGTVINCIFQDISIDEQKEGIFQSVNARSIDKIPDDLNVKEKDQISLREITQNSPIVFLQYSIKDLQIKIQYLSDNIHAHTGYTKEWLCQKHENVKALIYPDDRSKLLENFLKSQNKKRLNPFTFRIITKGGEIKWIKHYASFSKIDGIYYWTGACFDITEEFRIKKELHESNLRFSEILNSSVSVIVELSITGKIIAVSDSLFAVTGYKPEELIGKHFTQAKAFLKKDLWRMKALFIDLLNEKFPERGVECEWKHKNGDIRFAEGFVNSMGENGKLKGFQILLFDISYKKRLVAEEHKRLEDLNFLFDAAISMQKIHVEKEFYDFVGNKLYELIPGAIINVNSINDDYSQLRVETIIGISPVLEKTVGKLFKSVLIGFTINIKSRDFDYAKPGKLGNYNSSLYEMTLGEIPEFICQQVEKVIGFDHSLEASLGTTQEIMGGVAIFLRKDTKIKNIALINTFLREASNVLVRIKIQDRLQKSEITHRSLAENTENLILRLDKKANILYLNPVAESIAFRKKTSNKPMDLNESGLLEEEKNMFLEEFNKVLKYKTKGMISFPLTRQGCILYFDWYMYPEFEDNKLNTILVYANDVTDKKALEIELTQSIEFRRKLYAILAHDLKTPFNSMLGFFDLLQINYDNLTEEERKNYIRILKSTADKAYDLFDSVLLWSMDIEHLQKSKSEPCIIKDVINDIEILYRTKLEDKNIQIIKDFDPEACLIADGNMLAAIFRNLISNAIKFSHSNSKIKIIVEEMEGDYIIEINDEGLGMDVTLIDFGEEIKSKSRKDGTSGEKGSGLGLSFVKEFVRRSSGKIWFESEIGKGTSVFIKLPRCMA
ncbi:MAG: PAS domain S-box protein [Bacteroidales bacterium]|nr:PAS domain S-box protein [Bacteroidales bacterium]MCF8389907.1 PAS domain S-box protein [Bacteroidales bacterium]